MINKTLNIFKKIWKSKAAQRLVSLGSILLTISILGWLIYSQWDILKEALTDLRPQYLLFAFAVYSIVLFFTTGIWAQILNSLGHISPFRTHFFAFCISALGKRLPGTLWYIAWRANIYQDENHSTKLIVLTSGIELLAIVFAATIISVILAIPLINQFPYSIIGFVIVLIALIILMIPKVNRWIFNKLNVDFSKFSYTDMVIWTLQYIAVWILNGVLLLLIANIFGQVAISKLSYLIGSIALTGVLSRVFLFLPSNFGFGEVSLSLLLSGIMPTSLAAIIAISNRIIITTFEIIWALIALGFKSIYEKLTRMDY